MESHTCKLCNRSFRNGRSLGGHMRSHPQPQPPPTRRLRLTESTSHSHSPSFSSCSEDADANRDSSYGLRENPKRSVRLIDPEFSIDRESETESSKAIISHTRPRSTRSRRRLVPADEDLAFCLILMSRGHWRRPSKKLRPKPDEEEGDSRRFENAEEASGKFQKKARSRKRSAAGAIHQCPVCYKVFATGQALGGHKRAHFNAINSDEKKNDEEDAGKSWTSIDLNLPPPDQNQEEEDISALIC